MLYPEFAEALESGVLSLSDDFWVCDFRHETVLEKPIRHVAPAKVKASVVGPDNHALRKGRSIYYANHFFQEYGKTGKLLSKIIAPYDNTGFRSNTGGSINIFLTERECKAHYIEQCEKVKEQTMVARQQTIDRFDLLIADADEKIAGASA